MTIAEMYDLAWRHHKSGELQQAEMLYRQILQAQPNYAAAYHMLGYLAHQSGHHDAALRLVRHAIALFPLDADFHFNLAAILKHQGELVEAAQSYQHALEINPQYVEAFINLGNVRILQGQLASAADCFRQALCLDPSHAGLHNNLGVTLRDMGQLAEAAECYRKAAQLDPNYAEAHYNLGIFLQDQGRLDEAAICYRQALASNPDYAEAYNNLGIVLGALGRVDEALTAYRQAIQRNPNVADAYNNLGNALLSVGRPDEALANFRAAIRLKPDNPEAHYHAGNALRDKALLREAASSYREALRLKPDFAEAHSNLGIILCSQGQLTEAIASLRQAVRHKPDYVEARANLGMALCDQGLLDEGIASLEEALRLKPDSAEVYNNLGNARKDQGRLDEAMPCYQHARRLEPDKQGFASNMLYEEHCRWEKSLHRGAGFQPAMSEPVDNRFHPITTHENDPAPERRLRIGYVSPDFRQHCQALFTTPLLSAHNHESFEVFCYADVHSPDAVTERLQGYADAWRNVVGCTDEQIASMVRQDRIDILVDLAMHMSRNRILVFAHKPAPVQVTWLAYPGTTGLTTIDYRLTDPYLDPPGLFDHYYSESSYRLPHTFWCYDPGTEEPALAPLPALQNSFITFGCLNNFCKVNDGVLDLWARVLNAVPGSRLLLLAKEGRHRQRTIDYLAKQGIAAERVSFSSFKPRPEYLALYHQIDIGLDTIPYNGHTTTLDALWMGVPVITLVGGTVVGRAGLSQLTNVNLQELIAAKAEDYVRIAVDLAGDLPRLQAMRVDLRERLRRSPLMDAKGFVGGVEDAYRAMWHTWCQRR
jgi:protein O-GlcNAc transferase